MRRKIDLFQPKTIKNTAKNDDFRVFWAASDAGIEILLYGTVGDDYAEADAASIRRYLFILLSSTFW